MVSMIALALLAGQPQDGGGMAGSSAACPVTPAPLPPELAGFNALSPLAAGASDATAPSLTAGAGSRVALADAGSVTWAAAPGHPPAAGSRGGLLALTVTAAGRYRVALGGGAWIDMTGGGRSVSSVAHGHGPACSPVRKTVDFDLTPGRYLIQVSGTQAPSLGVMVVRVER